VTGFFAMAYLPFFLRNAGNGALPPFGMGAPLPELDFEPDFMLANGFFAMVLPRRVSERG
jgi:hypothetical protein